jgi:phosphoribosylglycinamide formyltransferase-1
MDSKPSVTVLISGRGSNLRALIQRQDTYKIAAVVSNTVDAQGLEIAKDHSIPCAVVEREKYSSLAHFKQGVLEAVKTSSPDFVALAGFMMLLQPEFVAAFPDRIINIHPSLLPKFPGLQTHAQALQANATEHGCSVHIVDNGLDSGPVLTQAVLTVLPNDEVDTLSARVLQLEHKLYPWTLSMFASGEINISKGEICYSSAARRGADELGFKLFVK